MCLIFAVPFTAIHKTLFSEAPFSNENKEMVVNSMSTLFNHFNDKPVVKRPTRRRLMSSNLRSSATAKPNQKTKEADFTYNPNNQSEWEKKENAMWHGFLAVSRITRTVTFALSSITSYKNSNNNNNRVEPNGGRELDDFNNADNALPAANDQQTSADTITGISLLDKIARLYSVGFLSLTDEEAKPEEIGKFIAYFILAFTPPFNNKKVQFADSAIVSTFGVIGVCSLIGDMINNEKGKSTSSFLSRGAVLFFQVPAVVNAFFGKSDPYYANSIIKGVRGLGMLGSGLAECKVVCDVK